MATPKKPPRPWDIDDLQDLGKKSGVTYLRAVPVLILEKWMQGEREEGVANFVRTSEVARRLQDSKLIAGFKKKGASSVLGSLVRIQNSRSLTRPPLIEYYPAWKSFEINLPHYEPLLQEYREIYREDYPEDYAKLFPKGEPDWKPPTPPKARVERKGPEPVSLEPKTEDEIRNLLALLERALRERQQAMDRLTEENQKLRAELVALQVGLQEGREVSHHRIVDEELRNDCAELLESRKYYINAIRSAGVVLEERLRNTMGGVGVSEYGTGLVDMALAKDSGRLVISEYPSEQQGVHMLFRGAVQFVRNPPMHKKLRYTELEARGAVGLIDYLLLLLRQAKPRE
jgi:hypothetical protein